MQHWSKDPPCLCQFINAYKVDLTSTEDVENQSLICIWHLQSLFTNRNLKYLAYYYYLLNTHSVQHKETYRQ